jgi:hypothetical protein
VSVAFVETLPLRRRRSTRPMPARTVNHQAALLWFEEATRQLQPPTASAKAPPVPAVAVPVSPPLEVASAPPLPGLPVLPPLPVGVVVVPPLPKAPPLAGLAPPTPWLWPPRLALPPERKATVHARSTAAYSVSKLSPTRAYSVVVSGR